MYKDFLLQQHQEQKSSLPLKASITSEPTSSMPDLKLINLRIRELSSKDIHTM